MEAAINVILAEMQPVLTPSQLKRLKAALERAFEPQSDEPNAALLKTFLTAKEVEGCSLKTLAYYESTLQKMTDSMMKPYTQIDSDDLRKYLNDYEASRGSSKVMPRSSVRFVELEIVSWRGKQTESTQARIPPLLVPHHAKTLLPGLLPHNPAGYERIQRVLRFAAVGAGGSPAWQALVTVDLGPGFAFPARYFEDDCPACFAAERSNRRDQGVAQLIRHIGHLERLDGSGDPARFNDGEDLGAIHLRGFCGHSVDLQKLLEVSRPFAADAAQRSLGQSAAGATAFRYRSARALQANEKRTLAVRQRPCVLGAHDAVDGRRAVVTPSAPSVIRGFLTEVAQNKIAPAGVLFPAKIPHVEGEPLLPGTLRVVLAFAARFRHEQSGLQVLFVP